MPGGKWACVSARYGLWRASSWDMVLIPCFVLPDNNTWHLCMWQCREGRGKVVFHACVEVRSPGEECLCTVL